MTIDLVYVYPGEAYLNDALRFLSSYAQHPPSVVHNTVVVCNSGAPDEICEFFRIMQNCRFLPHDNSGYDIGAYQAAARSSNSELIVFLGASSFARKTGWLLRMATAFQRHGNAIYGVMGNAGDGGTVAPHLRTTGFWLPTKLFNRYPTVVTRPEQRYPFEHGPNGLTQWVIKQGLKAWLVHWDDECEINDWPTMPRAWFNISRDDIMVGDHLSASQV